ncbi:MAG: hypothetical protein WD651_12870 [Acidimicrobiia bacterium]
MAPDRSIVHRGPLLIAILGLVVVRIILGWLAWDPGWTALTWDDFTRVLIAQEWATDPVAVPDLVWLPLHTWVLGAAFALVGWAFAANPMALAAVLHTAALIAAAAVVGRTAYWLTRSLVGGLITFAALLYAPWGFYLSLSGLGETFYYLAVAVVMAGIVRWTTSRRFASLVMAAAGIAVACALRYEGWWLALAWAGVLVWTEGRQQGLRRVPKRVLIAALAPFLVPAAWMVVNWALTGSPIFFAAESARYFLSAYGALESIPARLFYYPLSLLRSAPLLVPGLVALVFFNRTNPLVRRLALVTGLHLTLFYLTSVVSSAVGAFNERFMFAFVVALLPVLGTLPEVLRRLPRLEIRWTVAAGLLVLAGVVTTLRLADRPIEWTHSPDLLTLVEELGEAAPANRPLAVVIDPRMAAVESTPLRATYGDRLRIAVADVIGVEDPLDLPPDWDVFVARFPDPSAPGLAWPDTMIGRYGVWGPGAAALDSETAPCPCAYWQLSDESGQSGRLPSGPYAWLEFTTDDPLPDTSVILATTLNVPGGSTRGEIELRSTYGHGFNPGRMRVEVRVGGLTIESWDLSEPSRWHVVPFAIPEGATSVNLEVAVVALSDIETGWAWGRASTVLVRSVEVIP